MGMPWSPCNAGDKGWCILPSHMRFEGTITQWNEDRGFGFIEPTLGGQTIFVHASVLPQQARLAPLHRSVSFEVERNPQGKKRARQVQLIQAVRPLRRPLYKDRAPAKAGLAGWFSIPAFALVYLLTALVWHVPHKVAWVYLVCSLACCVAYALDKSAAQAGRWRISENTLLMLGLAGGWPGAIVAQQLLRHKTSKRSFRAAFWFTVVLNVAGFVALASPQGHGFEAWLR
jgi:uncharacterized membrane protein YsdA (DUF1294 family)/cold shock CspA family protein